MAVVLEVVYIDMGETGMMCMWGLGMLLLEVEYVS